MHTIKNLEEFQKTYPEGFESIALDITGFCNAKCKYCPSGNDLSHKGEFISLECYEKILQLLLKYKMCTSNTNFHIYGLGEPLLHPDINRILQITHKYGIKTNISTNASVIPFISSESEKAISRFLISMPGFSEESYKKIHGFSFEKIKKNAIRLRNEHKDIPFDMTYHIYQFNLNELDKARKFCEQYKIRFAPNYAVLMDKNKCMQYVENSMPYEELKDISKELFLGILDEQISASPENYCVFQERFLSINISGGENLFCIYKKI